MLLTRKMRGKCCPGQQFPPKIVSDVVRDNIFLSFTGHFYSYIAIKLWEKAWPSGEQQQWA